MAMALTLGNLRRVLMNEVRANIDDASSRGIDPIPLDTAPMPMPTHDDGMHTPHQDLLITDTNIDIYDPPPMMTSMSTAPYDESFATE